MVHETLLPACLWVLDLYGAPAHMKLNLFSPAHLSYVNLITRLAEEPRTVEKKFF